jgi:chromosome segregation ATPase
VLANNLKAAQ